MGGTNDMEDVVTQPSSESWFERQYKQVAHDHARMTTAAKTQAQRPGGSVRTLRVVEKVWGRELWLQADGGAADGYCGKVLEILPGAAGSKHWHREKHETWLVLDGAVRVEYDAGAGHRCETLRQGAVLALPPATWHRMTGLAPSGARIMEVSTPHADDDVVRMEPSRPAKRGKTPRG